MTFNDGLVLGRGHGGTAIYWSKNLKASSFSNYDGSKIGPKVRVRTLLEDFCMENDVIVSACALLSQDTF